VIRKQIYDLSINDMKVLAMDGKGEDTGFVHAGFMVLIDKNLQHGVISWKRFVALDKLSPGCCFAGIGKDPENVKFFSRNWSYFGRVVFFW